MPIFALICILVSSGLQAEEESTEFTQFSQNGLLLRNLNENCENRLFRLSKMSGDMIHKLCAEERKADCASALVKEKVRPDVIDRKCEIKSEDERLALIHEAVMSGAFMEEIHSEHEKCARVSETQAMCGEDLFVRDRTATQNKVGVIKKVLNSIGFGDTDGQSASGASKGK